ncbi:MAG: LPS export ABC transporter periplasmic protein LptC [Alphaproteobacteria bacterium]|nr:LPS export ABC transporter periplasmic protein LptC [Alphaproteobacteria bacterium]
MPKTPQATMSPAEAARAARAQEEQARGRLMRNWPRRRAVDASAALRHSQRVQQLKIALPIGAFVIVAAVLGFSSVNGGRATVALTFDKIERVEDDLRMIEPKLTGVDGEGRPYTVTAEAARQIQGAQDHVILSGIEADITLEDGKWIALSAGSGELDGKQNILDLDDGISVFSDMGYELRTQAAQVDLKQGVVTGETQVTGQGPLGVIHANGFTINRAMKQVTFTDGVETTYIPPPHEDDQLAQQGEKP